MRVTWSGNGSAGSASRPMERTCLLGAATAEPLPDHVLTMIARAGEMTQLTRLADAGLSCPDRFLFCAKDATSKSY